MILRSPLARIVVPEHEHSVADDHRILPENFDLIGRPRCQNVRPRSQTRGPLFATKHNIAELQIASRVDAESGNSVRPARKTPPLASIPGDAGRDNVPQKSG